MRSVPWPRTTRASAEKSWVCIGRKVVQNERTGKWSGRGEDGPGAIAEEEGLKPGPSGIDGEAGEAGGFGEAAVVGARTVGTGGAFDVFGAGMEREEPFGHGGAEEGKGGQSKDGGEMTGAGTIADEHASLVNERKQLRDRARAGGGGFVLLFVEPSKKEKVRNTLKNLLEVPFKFENLGSQIIFYQPDSGRII